VSGLIAALGIGRGDVVAVVGACLSTLAGAAPSPHQVCTTVTGEEISAAKAAFPIPWPLPVDYGVLPRPLPPSGCFAPESPPLLVSPILPGDLASRAPPTLL